MAGCFADSIRTVPVFTVRLWRILSSSRRGGISLSSEPAALQYLEDAGLPPAEAKAIAEHYSQAQLSALKEALFGVVILVLISFAFTHDLPHGKPAGDDALPEAARAGPGAEAV